jgi:hypothetical protein
VPTHTVFDTSSTVQAWGLEASSGNLFSRASHSFFGSCIVRVSVRDHVCFPLERLFNDGPAACASETLLNKEIVSIKKVMTTLD